MGTLAPYGLNDENDGQVLLSKTKSVGYAHPRANLRIFLQSYCGLMSRHVNTITEFCNTTLVTVFQSPWRRLLNALDIQVSYKKEMCCILIYTSSRIYESHTSGLLEATNVKLTQLKYILPRNSALTHGFLKVTLFLFPYQQKKHSSPSKRHSGLGHTLQLLEGSK